MTNLYPPTIIGGYEIACAQMVGALRARGHDVRVLTSVPAEVTGPSDDVVRVMRMPDGFHRGERPATRSNFWELEANLIDAGNVHALLTELQRFRPDVCYLWNLIGLGGLALVGALEYLGLPWVWHLGYPVPAYLCIFEHQVLPITEELSARMTGRFVAVGQGLVCEIERAVRLGDRVRLVPNWVVDDDHTALERAYFSGGTLRIAFAGRVVEEKGIFILVDALRQVRDGGVENFSLDVYGTGDLGGLRRAVAECGLESKVQLRSWVSREELRRELRAHDLLAFPTFSKDAFGIVGIEAAMEGCVPLISTPSGLSEWLVDGVDCLKALREPGAFADVIARVCRGETELEAIGRRGAAVVRRDFALSTVAATVEEELESAARPYKPLRPESTVYRLAVIAEGLARTAVASGADYLEGG